MDFFLSLSPKRKCSLFSSHRSEGCFPALSSLIDCDIKSIPLVFFVFSLALLLDILTMRRGGMKECDLFLRLIVAACMGSLKN